MRSVQGRFGVLITLAIMLTAGQMYAQDSASVVAVGSGVTLPLLEDFAKASETTTSLSITVTGTRAGLDQFCQGNADLTGTNRAISADEDRKCTENNIEYLELLVAHQIVAFVASPDVTFAQCITAAGINTVLAPSATFQSSTWNMLDPAFSDQPLSIFIPDPTSAKYGIVDRIVEGEGLRSDAFIAESDDEIINKVSTGAGVLGIVDAHAAKAAGDTIRVLELNANEATGCAGPEAANVEQRLYAAADQLFLYVNRASLGKEGLKSLLSFAVSDAAPAILQARSLSEPTVSAYETDRQILSGEGNLRPFSEASTSFTIPDNASGQVRIAGSPAAYSYIKTLTDRITARYPGLTFDLKAQGQFAGARRFCNGEAEVAIVSPDLSAEQKQNCEANAITTTSIPLGNETVVLVANADTPFLTCLTKEAVGKLWSVTATGSITSWDQVDPAFPAEAITLFAPGEGSTLSDLLALQTLGSNDPLRTDVADSRDDALYRAAAVGNVRGSLTYMSWSEYQAVLANNEARNLDTRQQLVAIDGGSGCVEPSVDTISAGTYPLARPVLLLVNKATLTQIPVQALLWTLASDDNYSLLDQSGLYGVGFGSLPALRNTLEKAFVDAAVAASQAVEVTAEATAEVTPEATPAS